LSAPVHQPRPHFLQQLGAGRRQAKRTATRPTSIIPTPAAGTDGHGAAGLFFSIRLAISKMAVAVSERHCGRAVRHPLAFSNHVRGVGGCERPCTEAAGSHPRPSFLPRRLERMGDAKNVDSQSPCPFLPWLERMRTEALAVAPKKARTAVADSGAVLVIREAQRQFVPTGMTHETHRIAANTGWAHRSPAKAPSPLKQLGGAAGKRSAPPQPPFPILPAPT
jgi:hypothetical protein